MKRNSDLICECGHDWNEDLYFDVERRWETTEVDGLLANAITSCPECGYNGLARGIIPDDDSKLKFYLKRRNSLHFPRGGWNPLPNEKSARFLDSEKELIAHLYKEPSAKTLNIKKIAHYLNRKLNNISVDIRKPFFRGDSLASEEFKEEIAKAKITNFNDPDFKPSSIDPEQHSLPEKALYDGFKLLSASRKLLDEYELDTRHIHLIFTDRFFGTWDEGDKRYHLRLSSYGFPKLISTKGIVEAPARPSKFYRMKRVYEEEPSKNQVDGEFLSYNDGRLTEVLKGISMQAIFYHLIGEPFCVNPQCRLFNGHWQTEVLRAQMYNPEFCDSHEKILKNINEERKNC